MTVTLFTCRGGRLTLPSRDLALVGRLDGGNLVVWPGRSVWERSELTPEELTAWSVLVAAAGGAMLAVLPQLADGCLNYWEAGNWALNEAAAPPGPKIPTRHRQVHLHLLGRNRRATAATHRWGEAPVFPTFAERFAWSALFDRLTPDECRLIVEETERRLRSVYRVPAGDIAPWRLCEACGYPKAADSIEGLAAPNVAHPSPPLQSVKLAAATVADAPVLANLLELYIHDLSEVFPDIQPGADGRFGYPALPLYWSEPEHRFAFLIRSDGRVVGFVLATRGSPVAADPTVLDIAEFFVIRRHRRSGVGRQAAFQLWNLLPGRWTVRVAEGNPGALGFWRGVVAEFTNGTATESLRPGQPTRWRVLSFESEFGPGGLGPIANPLQSL